MGRLLYLILLGLVGAAIVHIAVILLVPLVTTNSTLLFLQTNAPADRFEPLQISGLAPAPGEQNETRPTLLATDSTMSVAGCAYDLEAGPAHIVAADAPSFWSMTILDDNADSIYSLNSRNAADGAVDIVIATPVQANELRRALPEELANSVFVVSSAENGFVLLRVFAPDGSYGALTETFLRSASCEAL